MSDHPFRGTGAESGNLQQFKAYGVFFEDDNSDLADITLYIMDENCGSGSVEIGWDVSFDVKKMARIGAEGAGKELCIRSRAWHVPSGTSRRFAVFAYYSGGTSMR